MSFALSRPLPEEPGVECEAGSTRGPAGEVLRKSRSLPGSAHRHAQPDANYEFVSRSAYEGLVRRPGVSPQIPRLRLRSRSGMTYSVALRRLQRKRSDDWPVMVPQNCQSRPERSAVERSTAAFLPRLTPFNSSRGQISPPRSGQNHLSLAFEPVGILLQDVVIRHPRDVVGDHAGHALAGELGLAGNR